jgi:uncharacterized delta-60 repeat protein
MKRILYLAALMVNFGLTDRIGAAPGDLDTSFDAGSSLNNSPYAIAIQPDGKLLIGGDFTTVAGLMRNRIARLNTDGTGDLSFAPSGGANGHVRVIALQGDGKMLVGGGFTAIDGQPRNRIARLNADGTLDPSFNPGTGANDYIFSVAVQSDGKLLVGGYFTSINGMARNRIARLNADGTVDAGFNPGSGFDSYVYSVLLQPDGRVVVGGWFFSYNGVSRNGIARLNSNGTLDSTFNPGTGSNGYVEVAALQPDGRILIGGYFSQVNGVVRNGMARFYPNGTLDLSFDPGAGATDILEVIELQTDGKILVGGQFRSFNGSNFNSVVRLNATGAVDPTFHPTRADTVAGIAAIRALANGMILLSGYPFREPSSRDYLARVNADGSPDLSFNPGTGISGYGVFSAEALPSGKVLVWGNFAEVAGFPRPGIARLEASGKLDTTFQPPPMTGDIYPQYNLTNPPVVYSTSVQPDGKLVIGGAFTEVAGQKRGYVARLNEDGSFDPTFAQGAGADYAVYQVIVGPDGKVLVSGSFDTIDGVSRLYFARLNADGRLDPGFHPIVDGFGKFALQPDGNILLGGDFLSVNGITRGNIARIDSNGVLDLSFAAAGGPDNFVTSLSVQPDSKVLIGGFFNNVAGISRKRLARLDTNGNLDLSFAPQFVPEQFNPGGDLAGSYVAQADGKVFVWGGFTNVSGVPRPGFARLKTDGSLDTTFDPGTGPDFEAASVAFQSDSKVLVTGSFGSFNGVPRAKIARLLATEPPVIISQPRSRTNVVGTTATFTVTATGTAPLSYQWYKDNVALTDNGRISGSTSSNLTIAHVQFQDHGAYIVTVSDVAGSVTSEVANLKVVVPPVARILVSPLSRFPGITNLLVIAPNGLSAPVTLDASQSTSGSGEPLQYQWSVGNTIIGTGVTITQLLAVGQHQFTLVVTDGELQDTASVEVHIVAPDDAVQILIAQVENSNLSAKDKQPLLASLRAAADSFARGRFGAGLNQLGAFEHKVQAQVAPGDPVLARELLLSVQVIREAMQ